MVQSVAILGSHDDYLCISRGRIGSLHVYISLGKIFTVLVVSILCMSKYMYRWEKFMYVGSLHVYISMRKTYIILLVFVLFSSIYITSMYRWVRFIILWDYPSILAFSDPLLVVKNSRSKYSNNDNDFFY